MNKLEYIKDASLLLRDARSKKFKNLKVLTSDRFKSSASIMPTFRYIQDGWNNLISGLGGTHSKSPYTTYKAQYCINDSVLNSLWLSNGVSRKIINSVSDDSTKNGITIKNDDENLLGDKFKKLKGMKNINLADKYRRHYGGALIVIGLDDGGDLWKTINLNRIKSINWLKTYSRIDTYFTSINFTEDINDPNYGKPEFYTVVPKYTQPYNVHHTRVLEFKGLPISTELDNDYRYYWGMSVIEPLWETLKKNGASLENLEQLLYEVTISIYKIKDLAKLMCEGKWDDIKKIINTVNMSKSIINSIIQDSEDDYKRDNLTFAGIREIFEILMTYLSSESEIPVSRLFGKQLGGLNNEGEMELRMYYDMIKARQENDLVEPTQKLIDYINISQEFKNKVKDPIISYNSPWQLTEKEELENRKIQVEIDHQQIEDMIITPEQVAEQRLVNGWSYEMKIDTFDEEEMKVSVPEKE